MKITIFFTLIFIVSCTPQRRLQRLLVKHPELAISDTLTLTDTIKVEIPGSDTLVISTIEKLTDTIRLVDDNLLVEVYRIHDSIYIRAKQDTIYKTIFRTKKIPVTKFINRRPRDALTKFALLSLIVVLIMILSRNRNF